VQIRSDVNYRIAQLFREREIRIPYPAQEFLLKGMSLARDFEPSLVPDDDGPQMRD
jgi:small-conductance mechanosensitive channel